MTNNNCGTGEIQYKILRSGETQSMAAISAQDAAGAGLDL